MKKVLIFGIVLVIVGFIVGAEVFSIPLLGLTVTSAIVLVGGWIMGAAIVYLAGTNLIIRKALRGEMSLNFEEEERGDES